MQAGTGEGVGEGEGEGGGMSQLHGSHAVGTGKGASQVEVKEGFVSCINVLPG